jgi:trehalose 6-phosphate phosphatase
LRAARTALFLDVDGTLLGIESSPDAVTIDGALRVLLGNLARRFGGALALVSGRSIAVLDALLDPLELPMAGVHGFERRNASGTVATRASPERGGLDEARREMERWVQAYPRLILEDKVCALALHYRQLPQLEPALVDAVSGIAARRQGLKVQRGAMVVEIVPDGIDKATAIAEFMGEPPFHGRQPVYAGDDLTDEAAFKWVNAAGGISIAIGDCGPTAARSRLGSVEALRRWLLGLLGERQ